MPHLPAKRGGALTVAMAPTAAVAEVAVEALAGTVSPTEFRIATVHQVATAHRVAAMDRTVPVAADIATLS